MIQPEQPDPVERYLAGESELSRLYHDAPQAQASATLEQTILDAAREAAAQRAPRQPSIWQRFWQGFDRARMPVATAASIVLVVGVAMGVYRQYGLEVPADFDAPVPAAPASVPPTEAEPQVSAKKDAVATTPKIAQEKTKPVAAEPAKAEASVASGAEQRTRGEAENKLGKSMPAETPLAEEAATPRRAKLPAPAAVAQDKVSPVAESASKPAEAEQARKQKQDARSTPPAALHLMPLAEDWLEQIEHLVEQENFTQARRELKAFQQAYPAYELPERLKKLELK